MNEYILTLSIKVKIKTNLPIEEALEQFSSEAVYNFGSTDDVEVTDTEWEDSEITKVV
jgi:hypothetical protein